jgi:hypothetical protein
MGTQRRGPAGFHRPVVTEGWEANLKRVSIVLAASAAAALLATSASAATYADNWTTSASGGISVVFGDNGLGIPGAETIPGETITTQNYNAGTGDLTDTFSFMLPNGVVGFTLSSMGLALNSSLQVTSLTFNGASVDFTSVANGFGGFTVQAADGVYPVVLGGPQTLTVVGNGGPQAVFSGTGTFARAVPEPGAWALMILGFGGAGTMLRRHRRRLAFAA